MYSLEPITTFVLENADYSATDLKAEYQRYCQRQRAITACLLGQEHPDYLLDMLMEHSIDASEYVDQVVENIEAVISSNQPIEDAAEYFPFGLINSEG